MFFVDNKEIQIDLYVVYNATDGVIYRVSEVPIGNSLIDGVVEKQYKFYFSKPNFDDMSKYRQLSMYFDNKYNKTVVNPFKLRQYIILNHLKRWEGVQNEEGEDINLELDIDGTLSQSSLELIYSINSIVIDTLMTSFEKKMSIY